MTKEFNTTGSCNPAMHYMVDTSKKLAQIEELIDRGKYFTINRARQFGKTTAFYKGRWYFINELGEGLLDEAYQQNK